MSKGLQQVLWLFGPDREITEVGAMNIMVVLATKDGGELRAAVQFLGSTLTYFTLSCTLN